MLVPLITGRWSATSFQNTTSQQLLSQFTHSYGCIQNFFVMRKTGAVARGGACRPQYGIKCMAPQSANEWGAWERGDQGMIPAPMILPLMLLLTGSSIFQHCWLTVSDSIQHPAIANCRKRFLVTKFYFYCQQGEKQKLIATELNFIAMNGMQNSMQNSYLAQKRLKQIVAVAMTCCRTLICSPSDWITATDTVSMDD